MINRSILYVVFRILSVRINRKSPQNKKYVRIMFIPASSLISWNISYPSSLSMTLKRSENFRFSYIFKKYNRTLPWTGLKKAWNSASEILLKGNSLTNMLATCYEQNSKSSLGTGRNLSVLNPCSYCSSWTTFLTRRYDAYLSFHKGINGLSDDKYILQIRSSHHRCSVKKRCSQKFRKIH